MNVSFVQRFCFLILNDGFIPLPFSGARSDRFGRSNAAFVRLYLGILLGICAQEGWKGGGHSFGYVLFLIGIF